MLAMTAAIDWVDEDNHDGPAEAAEPAGTAVPLTFIPIGQRPCCAGAGW
jgi:hypothetical protein